MSPNQTNSVVTRDGQLVLSRVFKHWLVKFLFHDLQYTEITIIHCRHYTTYMAFSILYKYFTVTAYMVCKMCSQDNM